MDVINVVGWENACIDNTCECHSVCNIYQKCDGKCGYQFPSELLNKLKDK